MNLREIANREIPAALNTRVVAYQQGETRDIIKEVLACFKDSKDQVNNFAPYLRGKTDLETCRNIWNFWKGNITYRIDPDGQQWVKTPSAVWSSGFCDCKSFSVAVASTLYALGIKGKFRFASYGSNTTVPTHVYVVATPGGKEIIIDCVWTGFNSQKPFTKNWDYNMTVISRVSGLDTRPAKGVLDIDIHDHSLTEAELDLALAKQRLELEQVIARKNTGIGSTTDDAYQTEIEAHNAALSYIAGKKKKPASSSKPKVSKKLKKAVKKNDGKGVSKKQAKRLAKAGITVKKRKVSLLKKVAKGFSKIISTPIRLAAKSQLPKSAPFFLYLFIDQGNAALLAKLPEAVRIKRGKAQHYKDILINKLQMKESNFNSIVRNGIMSNFGKSPEDVLAKWMADANFRVGLIDDALKLAGNGLKMLLGKLGEQLQSDVENFSPAAEDWGAAGMTQELRTAMANEVQNSSSNNDPNTGYGSVRPLNEDGDYAVKEGSGMYTKVTDADGDGLDDVTGKKITYGPDGQPIGVEDTPPADEGNSSGNGLLILGIVGVGLYAMTSK